MCRLWLYYGLYLDLLMLTPGSATSQMFVIDSNMGLVLAWLRVGMAARTVQIWFVRAPRLCNPSSEKTG